MPRKTLLFALAATLLLGTLSCQTAEKKAVSHVVLISLDGSRPAFYMDSSWHAPNLQNLRKQGVFAAEGIQSIFPSVTYPSHTSLITGAYPATHGIYYNAPMGANPGHWYWEESAIQCKTLWDAAKAAGLSTGAVFWPVTVGAPITYNFPVRRPEKGEKGDRLTIKYPYITPKDLLKEVEQQSGKAITAADLGEKDYAQSKTIATLSNYIIKTYKPSLMAVHFVGMDHAEHAHGTDGPEIHAMVRVTDSLVGTVIDAIKAAGIWDSTAVIITGDHGHTNITATFAPNVYLKKQGLITKKDWKAKFHSGFLYLKDTNDQATLDSVVQIMKNTPEYQQGDFRIWDRKKLDQEGANPEVALALAMKEGIKTRNGENGPVMTPHTGPAQSSHGFDPAYPSMHTSFIAVGAGIAAHKNITGMGIKDVAPIVARLLHLDFKAPDGILFPGILAEDDTTKNNP